MFTLDEINSTIRPYEYTRNSQGENNLYTKGDKTKSVGNLSLEERNRIYSAFYLKFVLSVFSPRNEKVEEKLLNEIQSGFYPLALNGEKKSISPFSDYTITNQIIHDLTQNTPLSEIYLQYVLKEHGKKATNIRREFNNEEQIGSIEYDIEELDLDKEYEHEENNSKLIPDEIKRLLEGLASEDEMAKRDNDDQYKEDDSEGLDNDDQYKEDNSEELDNDNLYKEDNSEELDNDDQYKEDNSEELLSPEDKEIYYNDPKEELDSFDPFKHDSPWHELTQKLDFTAKDRKDFAEKIIQYYDIVENAQWFQSRFQQEEHYMGEIAHFINHKFYNYHIDSPLMTPLTFLHYLKAAQNLTIVLPEKCNYFEKFISTVEVDEALSSFALSGNAITLKKLALENEKNAQYHYTKGDIDRMAATEFLNNSINPEEEFENARTSKSIQSNATDIHSLTRTEKSKLSLIRLIMRQNEIVPSFIKFENGFISVEEQENELIK